MKQATLEETLIPFGTVRNPLPDEPWKMTPWEYAIFQKSGKMHGPTGKTFSGEDKAKTPIGFGEINGYSFADIAHFYTQRNGGDWSAGWLDMMDNAILEGKDVPYPLVNSWKTPNLKKEWIMQFGKPISADLGHDEN